MIQHDRAHVHADEWQTTEQLNRAIAAYLPRSPAHLNYIPAAYMASGT